MWSFAPRNTYSSENDRDLFCLHFAYIDQQQINPQTCLQCQKMQSHGMHGKRGTSLLNRFASHSHVLEPESQCKWSRAKNQKKINSCSPTITRERKLTHAQQANEMRDQQPTKYGPNKSHTQPLLPVKANIVENALERRLPWETGKIVGMEKVSLLLPCFLSAFQWIVRCLSAVILRTYLEPHM